LSIENYSLHRSTRIDLEPVTVLVGRNGGGKSALLDALQLLGRTARGSLSEVFEETGPFSYRARLFHGVDQSQPMTFRVGFSPGADGDPMDYELAFGPDEHMRLVVQRESLSNSGGPTVFTRDRESFEGRGFDDLLPDMTVLAQARRTSGYLPPEVHQVRNCAYALGRVLRFRIDAWAVGTDTPEIELPENEAETPREPGVGTRGDNTAAFLYWLRDYHGPILRALEADIRSVIPGFAAFDFSTARPGRISFLMGFNDDRGTVDSINLSSGTLSTVALLALARVRGARGPKVLCIEEPELGLTPGVAQSVFAKLLGNTAQSQLLITSHSPHILCAALGQPDTAVLRVIPDDRGVADVLPVREAALQEHGVPGPVMLKEGGGVDVAFALKLMEGLD
jgi:predicted ATPase